VHGELSMLTRVLLAFSYLHFSGAFSRSRIRMSPLSPDGESSPMPQTTITSQVHQSLDVHLDFAAEIALYLVRMIQYLTDFSDIHLGELIRFHVRIQTRLIQNLPSSRSAYTVNVCERNFHALVFWEVDPCNTRHDIPPTGP
jgi:hypothetical protein